MKNNYDILIEKLDAFIRKYYKNLVVRGSIYSLGSVAILFLLVTGIEYFAHLNTSLRAVLFFSFLVLNLVIISRFIVWPLLKIYRLGKLITHEKAAQIIGSHFTEVADKLLNILQLKKLADSHPHTKALIEAGIDQKIRLIKPVPFNNAINLKENKRYIKYAGPPLFLLLLLLISAPRVITEPTTRLFNYHTHFEKLPPFEFIILNEQLDVLQNDNYTLEVKVSGNELPAEVFITVEGNTYMLSKKSPSRHQYTFRNIQRNIKFQLSAVGVVSEIYEIMVMPKPIILEFEIDLQYPAYTGKKSETIKNTGDLLAPEGSLATWRFHTRDTRFVHFNINDSLRKLEESRPNYFTYSQRLFKNGTYSISTQNEYVAQADSVAFNINVVPDAYPSIEVQEYRDSILDKNLFFAGSIKDDYGFRNLTFNYRIIDEKRNNENTAFTSKGIEINKTVLQQAFYHQFNLNTIDLKGGDVVEYYFEVWDNDGINGSKAIRTRTYAYKTLTESEIQEKTDMQTEQLFSQMQSVMKDAQSIQKSIDDLNRKILEKKTLNWQDRKSIEELLQKNKDLEKNVEEIQKSFEHKEQWEEQYKELNADLLQKQQELNKLLEELMTDEMKELMEELEKMMDKLDRDKVKDMLDKMKFNTEDIEKQLDRSLELMKQFEFEKKLSETIEKLDKLAEEQKQLSEDSKDKDTKSDDLLQEQERLNEAFDKLQESISDLHQKNENLEKPNKFEKTDEQQKAIEQQMQKSSESLQKDNKNRASESQKNAAEQMQELSDKLKEMEAEMMQDNLAEDIDALRMILENLLRTSFAQEDLILELRRLRTNDPRYVALIQEQNKLKDDLKMIQDSLFALSKRQVQIESFVNREIADINSNIEKAIEALVDRKVNEAASRQQYVMTHVNNLALMLSETLSQMNMQMAAQQSGDCKSSCKKPGSSGEQSFRSLRQMQEALNKMLQDMKDGKQPQGREGQSLSEQLARAAAQQEAIRNHLQSLAEELKKQGMGNSRELDQLQKEMEQTETDIVNKMLTQQTLKRQQDILTRLLEHERAERERELEEQRQSQEAKNQKFSNPNDFFKYKRLKEKEEELLKTVPPSFNIFYKNKVNEYFYNFQE